MDLTTIMNKIDCHQYSTCAQYLADVDLIMSNALKYNPDRDPMDKLIRHRACELSDMAHSVIKSQLEPEFEKVRYSNLKVISSDALEDYTNPSMEDGFHSLTKY